MTCRILLPLLLVGLLALACDLLPSDPLPVNNPSDSPTDTLDNCDEADRLAIWLSGELTAPWALSERIRDDLQAIRASWQDSVPAVAIQFSAPWRVSIISAGVGAETWAAMKRNEYSAWNNLNETYGFEFVDSLFSIYSTCFIYLYFAGCQNPIYMEKAYDTLPGFSHAEASGRVGDWPVMLAYDDNERMIYFFRDAWGDCPSGCIHSTIDLFVSDDRRLDYYGHYGEGQSLPEPWNSWFAELFWRYRLGEK